MTNYQIEDEQSAQEFLQYIKEDNPKYSIEQTDEGHLVTTDEFNVLVPQSYRHVISKMKYGNPLIYGKDPTEGIVAAEVEDDQLVLYKNDGTTEKRQMVYWLLAPKAYDKNFKRLEGDQHYKYIRRFKDKKRYMAIRKKYYSKDIYCVWDEIEAAMIYYGFTMFKGLKVQDVSVLSFDIEAAGLARNKDSEVYLITNTFRDSDGTITKKHFRLDNYRSDVEMIHAWCSWVRRIDPSVLTGHNLYGYDLDYLQFCYSTRDGGNAMLPLGKGGKRIKVSQKASKFRVDGNTAWDYHKVKIHGRHIIDGMFLAVKHDIGRNYPSWGLKPIAEYEGIIKEGRQFYDASKIRENWPDPIEREKIVAYGIDDSDDSLGLYDIMIPSIFYMTQYVPKPFQVMGLSASGSQLNAVMVRAYLQENYSIPKASEKEYVAGGMSYGIPGLYENVVKLDAKSFYPSTIIAFDIYDDKKDPKKYFLEMVKYFTYRRFEQKDMYKQTGDKYYDDMQSSSKVFINSSYGLLGTPGLNYNSFQNAQSITRKCRASLQKAILWATGRPALEWWPEYEKSSTHEQDYPENLMYGEIDGKSKINVNNMDMLDHILVNLDTDSLSFCKKDMEIFSDDEYTQLQNELNDIMYSEWEDDGKFSKVLIAKAKNYVLVDESGEVKKKGSSITDTKKEPALIEMLDTLIADLLDTKGANVKDIYHRYIIEATNIQDISRWATKKSITKSVLNPTRTNEQKVLDALKGKDIQEGDKVYLYSAIDGECQDAKKGELQFDSKGNAKMIPNRVLRCVEEFANDYDREHYVKRVYMTLEILKNVIDLEGIVKYHLKGNKSQLEELINNV